MRTLSHRVIGFRGHGTGMRGLHPRASSIKPTLAEVGVVPALNLAGPNAAPPGPWPCSPQPARRWRQPSSCRHRLPTLTRTAPALTPRHGTSPLPDHPDPAGSQFVGFVVVGELELRLGHVGTSPGQRTCRGALADLGANAIQRRRRGLWHLAGADLTNRSIDHRFTREDEVRDLTDGFLDAHAEAC